MYLLSDLLSNTPNTSFTKHLKPFDLGRKRMILNMSINRYFGIKHRYDNINLCLSIYYSSRKTNYVFCSRVTWCNVVRNSE